MGNLQTVRTYKNWGPAMGRTGAAGANGLSIKGDKGDTGDVTPEAEAARQDAVAAAAGAQNDRTVTEAARDEAQAAAAAAQAVGATTDGVIASRFGDEASASNAAVAAKLRDPATVLGASVKTAQRLFERSASVLREAEIEAQLAGLERQTVPGTTDGPIVPSTGASPLETDLGMSTITSSGSTITTPAAHGLAVGDRVRFNERTGGSGLNGNPYYVRSVPTTTTLTLYAGNAASGSIANISTDGTARVIRNLPETFGSWNRSAGAITSVMAGDAAGDDVLVCATPHGLEVGDQVGFLASTIGGVSNDTYYWVKDRISATKFRVSTTRTRTTAVDITSDGTATLTRSEPKMTKVRFPVRQRGFSGPSATIGAADGGLIQVGPGIAEGSFPERRMRLTRDRIVLQIFRSGSSGMTHVYVDGVMWRAISDADLGAAGVNNSTVGLYPLYFTDSRPREISVLGGDFAGFQAVAGADVTAPALVRGARWVFVADSFGGTGAAGLNGGLINIATRALGLRDVVPMPAGSTGYDAPGDRLPWADHPEDVLAVIPNIVVPMLGLNDLGRTISTVVSRAQTCWDNWTSDGAVMPIVFGPWPNNGGVDPSAGLFALDAALQVAAEARGARFASPLQDGVTFTRADGPHPDKPGARRLGRYVAAQLRPLL